MKEYIVRLLVDEDLLIQAHSEGHGIAPEDCPSTDEMIQTELTWVLQSGIDLVGDIKEIKESNE